MVTEEHGLTCTATGAMKSFSSAVNEVDERLFT
jgi:hypothetical protein